MTDDLGVGVRGEVARSGKPATSNTLLWEITATIDYALTDNLKTLLEVRYDRGAIGGGSNDFFTGSNGDYNDADQTLALIQMMYTF